jgi:hypothetical protein
LVIPDCFPAREGGIALAARSILARAINDERSQVGLFYQIAPREPSRSRGAAPCAGVASIANDSRGSSLAELGAAADWAKVAVRPRGNDFLNFAD